MNQENIVITGGNGQLGKALQDKYPEAIAIDIDELDITDANSVDNFDWLGKKIILNAAAYTNVDGAERPENRELAYKVNAEAVANLARVAIKNEITLVHISTDYVFDGAKNPHTEDESFSPLNVYGASKAAGDKAANQVPRHYILRTCWLMGDGKNFVRTMLDLAKKGINPVVVSDQIGRPTFTTTLVNSIDHLLTNNLPYGTYNVSNEGKPVSWANLTRNIYKIADFDNKVTDITTKEYFEGKEYIAPRPINSIFDLGKIEASGFNPNDWQDDLEKYVNKELNK
jgi:dTDP-4-dehydrorhamnose 3,5-epimerase